MALPGHCASEESLTDEDAAGPGPHLRDYQ